MSCWFLEYCKTCYSPHRDKDHLFFQSQLVLWVSCVRGQQFKVNLGLVKPLIQCCHLEVKLLLAFGLDAGSFWSRSVGRTLWGGRGDGLGDGAVSFHPGDGDGLFATRTLCDVQVDAGVSDLCTMATRHYSVSVNIVCKLSTQLQCQCE